MNLIFPLNFTLITKDLFTGLFFKGESILDGKSKCVAGPSLSGSDFGVTLSGPRPKLCKTQNKIYGILKTYALGEASSPPESEHPALYIMKFLHFFLFRVLFGLNRAGSTDPLESGSETTIRVMKNY